MYIFYKCAVSFRQASSCRFVPGRVRTRHVIAYAYVMHVLRAFLDRELKNDNVSSGDEESGAEDADIEEMGKHIESILKKDQPSKAGGGATSLKNRVRACCLVEHSLYGCACIVSVLVCQNLQIFSLSKYSVLCLLGVERCA